MRVVRFHVHAVVPDGNPTINVPGSIIDQTTRYRPRMVPHDPSGTGIKAKRIIRRSHEHHSVHNNRGSFEPIRVLRVKYPFGA